MTINDFSEVLGFGPKAHGAHGAHGTLHFLICFEILFYGLGPI